MMPVMGAPFRDSEVHAMSRNHRSFSNQGSSKSNSSKSSRELGVESLEARKVMCATCVALDAYLAEMAGSAQAEGAAADGMSAPAVAPIDVADSVSDPDAPAAETGTKCCCPFCTVSSTPSADDLTLEANVGGSGNGLTLNSSPGSKSSVPQVWVTAPAYGIRGSDAVFTVSLDRAPGDKPVTIKFATKNGGAAAGKDFDARSGTLTFSGNETFKEIFVPIRADAPIRTPKPSNFSVVLSSATNGKIVGASSTTSIVNDREGFQIDINFIGNVPLVVQGAAKAAVNKWQSAIIADLPNVVVGGRFIDDFLMNVQMGLIGGQKSDGENGVLANAWPMDPEGKKPAIRAMLPNASDDGRNTAYLGTTGIDPADTGFANLTAVLTHEMGHALGIGSFWKYQNFFKEFPDLKLIDGDDTETPTYVGANAVAQYQSYGKTDKAVPVQPYVLGHWDENYLGNELMTPFADEGRNPISRVTLGALADLGYTVNYGRADSYVLNGPLASTAGNGSSGTSNGILTGGWGIVVTIRQPSQDSSSKPSQGTASGDQSAITITVTPTKQQPVVTTPSRPATGTRQFVVVRQGQAPVTVTTGATLRPSRSKGFAAYGS
jgi:hypothetical protein